MTDRPDLESRIFLAIAKTMPTKQPAAVLAEIERTHVLVERDRWERVQTALWSIQEEYLLSDDVLGLQSGDVDRTWIDLDPIRHDAAESDTPSHAHVDHSRRRGQ